MHALFRCLLCVLLLPALTAMAAPPLSFAGVYESLRIPTLRDLVFSAKAYLAAAVLYFVMCYALSWAVKRLHQKIAIIR